MTFTGALPAYLVDCKIMVYAQKQLADFLNPLKKAGTGLYEKILILIALLLFVAVTDCYWLFSGSHREKLTGSERSYLQANSQGELTIAQAPMPDISHRIAEHPLNSFFFEVKLPINRASREELLLVSGIGPVLADSILVFREKNGTLQSANDLQSLYGVGEKKAAKLIERLTLADPQ